MRHAGSKFGFGVLVLMIGALILADLLFDLGFPAGQLLLAIVLLALGARMIVHALRERARPEVEADAWLASRHFAPTAPLDGDARYDIVLGHGAIDLRKLPAPHRDVTVTVDTVFGSSVITVDPSMAYDVEGSSAFGQLQLPDHRRTSMGSLSYQRADDLPPRLHLRLNTVFGSCHVVETG